VSATDLRSDALAMYAEYREAILAVAAGGAVLLFLTVIFGGRGLLGGLLFVGYGMVWLVVVAFVIWLFYRLVVAAERIAGAQERLASAAERRAAEQGTDSAEPDAEGADETETAE
jgi:fatty acid desaturase